MTLLTQLSRLESDGLLQVAMTHPDLEYLFRHALVKDAAYLSLVKGDRRALHRAAGEVLEVELGCAHGATPRSTERLPELAYHFGECGDAARGLRYATLAGDAAAASYANAEAIGHYTRALAWAAQTPITANQLQHLYLSRGRAQELSGDYAAAIVNYAELEDAGRRRAEPALELAALIQQVVIRSIPSPGFDAAQAAQLAARALPLAQRLGDAAAEARLAWARMFAETAVGHYAAASAASVQAVALARGLNNRELLATTLEGSSRVHMTNGDYDRAEAVLTEAAALWRELHNVPMLAETYTTLGGLIFTRGHYEAAFDQLREGLRLAESINNAWGIAYNLMYQGYMLLDRGDFSAAIHVMQRCLVSAREGGFTFPEAGITATLGVAYTYLGDDAQAEAMHQIAQHTVDTILPTEAATVSLNRAWRHLLVHDDAGAAKLVTAARQTIDPNDHLTANPFILALVEGELALRAGRPTETLAAVAARLDRPGQMDTQAFVTDLGRLRGEALVALNRLAEAEQVLVAAHTQATRQPTYRTLWTICAALARLAEQRGDAAEAARWRAESDRHRDYLAEHIDNPTQRATFLALAEQRAPTRLPAQP